MGKSGVVEGDITQGGESLKICLVCSHGGHLTEMLRLMDAFEGQKAFLITYDEKTTRGVRTANPIRNYLIKIRNTKIFQLNFFQFLLHMIYITLEELKIFLKERPDIIVSTGSEIAIPICYLGKFLGKKIIFIESLSRVNDLSRTGKLIYPIATLFLVQWNHLTTKYKKARYEGRVL